MGKSRPPAEPGGGSQTHRYVRNEKGRCGRQTSAQNGTANLLPGVLASRAAVAGVPAVSRVPAVSGAPVRSGARTALGWHELRDSGKLPNGTREVTVLIRPERRGPVTAWAARPTEAAGSPGPADAESA